MFRRRADHVNITIYNHGRGRVKWGEGDKKKMKQGIRIKMRWLKEIKRDRRQRNYKNEEDNDKGGVQIAFIYYKFKNL